MLRIVIVGTDFNSFWPSLYLSINILKANIASVVLFPGINPCCCSLDHPDGHWQTSDGPGHALAWAEGPCMRCRILIHDGVVCYLWFSLILWSQLSSDIDHKWTFKDIRKYFHHSKYRSKIHLIHKNNLYIPHNQYQIWHIQVYGRFIIWVSIKY